MYKIVYAKMASKDVPKLKAAHLTEKAKMLIDLLREKGIDIAGRHMDCGIEIFDADAQDTHAGGSGCGCSAVTLAAYILPKLESGEWKKVLFLPTGALLSKTSFNEGKSVPGIAHAVVLESPVVK